ncbi:DNA-3-methyladenine glycosylase [Methanorbis rubei]|uniref:DNA-3-methyladenine glycosylase n=1 Tax=Methanorbis rubei TaxID=3028300 RepID=A0AAE4MG43_9EURY|nr:DNA-3-methyladenine glycosylase [Methanocorpusculaceae archaeon Cs1]
MDEEIAMQYFSYGEKEIARLAAEDPVLGAAMDRLGRPDRVIFPDLFSALIRSVVGQQISTKAADTVWNRMQDALGNDITPDVIALAGADEIQQCGMSKRKAGYICGIADAVAAKKVDISTFRKKSDEEIIKELTVLPGVGVWTAEMMLLLSMERPDVLSWNDLGIRRGIMRLYDMPSLSKSEFEILRNRYSPHGSVASIYLWEIAHTDCW